MDEIAHRVHELDAILSAFPTSNAQLTAECAALRARIATLENSARSLNDFNERFTASGLNEDYQELLAKLQMMSAAEHQRGTPAASASSAGTRAAAVAPISVSSFLDQYRPAFDRVRMAGNLPHAEAAWRDLFAVGRKTDDILLAQIVIERERLLWQVQAQEALDSAHNTLRQHDPLQRDTALDARAALQAYPASRGEEELDYRLPKAQAELHTKAQAFAIRAAYARVLGAQLRAFDDALAQVLAWKSPDAAQENLNRLSTLRETIRRTLAFLQDDLDLSSDELLSDEGIAIWLLDPRPTDATGRVKSVISPDAFARYRTLLADCISADSLATIVLRAAQQAQA